jgi:hypothetical protein
MWRVAGRLGDPAGRMPAKPHCRAERRTRPGARHNKPVR